MIKAEKLAKLGKWKLKTVGLGSVIKLEGGLLGITYGPSEYAPGYLQVLLQNGNKTHMSRDEEVDLVCSRDQAFILLLKMLTPLEQL